MSATAADLFAQVPEGTTRAIVIHPDTDGKWACRWVGVSPEQAAHALYEMADAVVDQRIPPPDWRTRIK